jgi:hypothetical protein
MDAYNNLPGQECQMWGAFTVQCRENVELRPASPAANRRGYPSTTHTRPAESVPTLKPWPKPWVSVMVDLEYHRARTATVTRTE